MPTQDSSVVSATKKACRVLASLSDRRIHRLTDIAQQSKRVRAAPRGPSQLRNRQPDGALCLHAADRLAAQRQQSLLDKKYYSQVNFYRTRNYGDPRNFMLTLSHKF